MALNGTNSTDNFGNQTIHESGNITSYDVSNLSDDDSLSSPQAFSRLSEVALWLMVYVIPVIVSFGVFGNVVSFVVFLSEKMRRVSTNIYLAALSASNGVFLLAVGITWMDVIGLKPIHQNGVCQATVYLTYCSGFISVWLVVCITVENFVINFFLHKASKHCTVPRALSFVLLMCVSGFLLYDFAVWTTGMNWDNNTGSPNMYCSTYSEYRPIVEMYTLVDVVITLIIPTCVILALVIPTCVKNISRNSSGAAAARVMLSRKERALLRVTRLLCVIIVSYVVLTAPSHLNKLRHLLTGDTDSKETGTSDMLIVYICQVLYHLSFSMNFIYFLLWGKNFRQKFRHMFVTLHKLLIRCPQKLFWTNY